jgi:Mg/Co/Ni transporter MgtE
VGQVTRLLAAYDLLALPVLDAQRRLLGVVTVDDVLDHILPDDWRGSDDERLEAIAAQAAPSARRESARRESLRQEPTGKEANRG